MNRNYGATTQLLLSWERQMARYVQEAGLWYTIISERTVDECLEAIKTDAWFHP